MLVNTVEKVAAYLVAQANAVPRNRILIGNVIDVLKDVPDDSISCSVSSPPYFDQRDYGGYPVVFGGDPGCKHENMVELQPLRKWTPGDVPGPGSKVNAKRGLAENRPSKNSRLCSSCGAWEGELGLEPDPDLYVSHLADCYDVVWYKLRDDGTNWVNISDKHAPNNSGSNGVKGKSYYGVPERFMLEMIRRGWILRSKNVWVKCNPIPGSQDDRDTVNNEMIYQFVKNNKPLYHTNSKTLVVQREKPPGLDGVQGTDWDWDTCGHCKGKGKVMVKGATEPGWFDLNLGDAKEMLAKAYETCKYCKGTGYRARNYWKSHDYYYEMQYDDPKSIDRSPRAFGGKKRAHGDNATYSGREYIPAENEIGAVARSTWTFCTNKYGGDHHATFPEELPRRCIERSSPKWICKKCGLPQQPVTEISVITVVNPKEKTRRKVEKLKRLGVAKCTCNAGFVASVVLDPFLGSGQTAKVARQKGLDWLGCEINEKYAAEAMKNIGMLTRLI